MARGLRFVEGGHRQVLQADVTGAVLADQYRAELRDLTRSLGLDA